MATPPRLGQPSWRSVDVRKRVQSIASALSHLSLKQSAVSPSNPPPLSPAAAQAPSPPSPSPSPSLSQPPAKDSAAAAAAALSASYAFAVHRAPAVAIAVEAEAEAEAKGQWLSAALLGQMSLDDSSVLQALVSMQRRAVPHAVDVRCSRAVEGAGAGRMGRKRVAQESSAGEWTV